MSLLPFIAAVANTEAHDRLPAEADRQCHVRSDPSVWLVLDLAGLILTVDMQS
jgi:hypothetical protein